MVKFENGYSIIQKKKKIISFDWLQFISGVILYVAYFFTNISTPKDSFGLLNFYPTPGRSHPLPSILINAALKYISLPLSPFAHLCKQHLVNRHFLLDQAKNQAVILDFFPSSPISLLPISAEKTIVDDFPP